jgi:hypothetical protein
VSQTGRDLVGVRTSGTELIGGRIRCFVRRGRVRRSIESGRFRSCVTELGGDVGDANRDHPGVD